MIYMITLRAGAGHNGSVGNRRAMISTYGAGHAGGNGYDHKLRVGVCKYGNYDRNQNAEGTP